MHNEHEPEKQTLRKRLRAVIEDIEQSARPQPPGEPHEQTLGQLAAELAAHGLIVTGIAYGAAQLSLLPAWVPWAMLALSILQFWVVLAMHAGDAIGYKRAIEDERARALRQARSQQQPAPK